MGVESGVIEKRGAFYSFNDTRLGQGRENAKQFLAENPEITVQIEHQIRESNVNWKFKALDDAASGSEELEEAEDTL